MAGGAPFVVLGLLHVLMTPLAVTDRKPLSPADPALAEAMARGRMRLTKATDVWRCWAGFNLSHGLGAAAFGAFVVTIGRSPESFAPQAAFCVPLAVLVSGAFLAIAVRFWFRTPIAGCAFSFACCLFSLLVRLL